MDKNVTVMSSNCSVRPPPAPAAATGISSATLTFKLSRAKLGTSASGMTCSQATPREVCTWMNVCAVTDGAVNVAVTRTVPVPLAAPLGELHARSATTLDNVAFARPVMVFTYASNRVPEHTGMMPAMSLHAQPSPLLYISVVSVCRGSRVVRRPFRLNCRPKMAVHRSAFSAAVMHAMIQAMVSSGVLGSGGASMRAPSSRAAAGKNTCLDGR